MQHHNLVVSRTCNPPGAGWRPGQFESQRPEQTTPHSLMQQHAQSFFAQTWEATGAAPKS